jgi:hypothetical protein
MAYMSYRYPRRHLRVNGPADQPWDPSEPQGQEPIGEVDPTEVQGREEIDLTEAGLTLAEPDPTPAYAELLAAMEDVPVPPP